MVSQAPDRQQLANLRHSERLSACPEAVSGGGTNGRTTQFDDNVARGAVMRQPAPRADVTSMHWNSPRAQRARSTNFWTLPEPVSGNSSRNTQ